MSLRSLSSDLLDGVGAIFCTLWVHEMFGASTTVFLSEFSAHTLCLMEYQSVFLLFRCLPMSCLMQNQCVFLLYVSVHELSDREPVCFSAICVCP